MRFKILLCLLLSSSFAFAKDPKAYQTGTLVGMESVNCGVDERGKADSGHKKTHELLCQEYVLQGESVIYRLRPRDEKHLVLLPVGQRAAFRVEKDKLVVRAEGFDGKEREYIVVSMTPRTDANSAEATPAHVNHLQ